MSRAGEGGCNCLIRHARTPEERARVARDLDYARAVGCNVGMMVSLASLGACPVDAKPTK